MLEAEEDLRVAETAFRDAELSGDSDAIDSAWSDVGAALAERDGLRGTRSRQLVELWEAEDTWEKDSIWLEQYKNDYEAQSDQFRGER